MPVDISTQNEEICSTQPSAEIAEKAQFLKKGKKVWGPDIPTRRSKRGTDDGRTMLEKAQDLKRKHALEVKGGMKQTSKPISIKDSLITIAAEFGIISKDGNPFYDSTG